MSESVDRSPSSLPAAAAAPTSPELPLPSLASLAKATGISLVSAILLLVFVVLPAEYNVDPTGFGRVTGLTRLSMPAEGEFVEDDTPQRPPGGTQKDSVVIEVPPGKGVEYKFWLRSGEKMQYSWQVDTGTLRFDFHGEDKREEKDYYESYAKSTAQKTRGTFTAPFDGVHGWWWKNKGQTVAKVTLDTSGSYEVLGLR